MPALRKARLLNGEIVRTRFVAVGVIMAAQGNFVKKWTPFNLATMGFAPLARTGVAVVRFPTAQNEAETVKGILDNGFGVRECGFHCSHYSQEGKLPGEGQDNRRAASPHVRYRPSIKNGLRGIHIIKFEGLTKSSTPLPRDFVSYVNFIPLSRLFHFTSCFRFPVIRSRISSEAPNVGAPSVSHITPNSTKETWSVGRKTLPAFEIL